MACCLFWVLLLVGMLAPGCSKHEAASDSNAATNAAQPSARGPGPMPPPSKAAVIADTGDVNATLGELSMELRRYVVRTRSVPKNFEEFVAKSHVQAPAPPVGKKYAIKDQAVVLVKR
jgi:hypothetical protein